VQERIDLAVVMTWRVNAARRVEDWLVLLRSVFHRGLQEVEFQEGANDAILNPVHGSIQ
jgi:hypothetical protein